MAQEHFPRIATSFLLFLCTSSFVVSFAPLTTNDKTCNNKPFLLRNHKEGKYMRNEDNRYKNVSQNRNATDASALGYVTYSNGVSDNVSRTDIKTQINTESQSSSKFREKMDSSSTTPQTKSPEHTPFPTMPSQTFLHLVNSQFELLANSILLPHSSSSTSTNKTEQRSKIKSMALYLPQENPTTGQLEFVPSAVYPCPTTERVFIASDAESGLPPFMPPTLTTLPGFTHAQTLIPTYPFAASSTPAGASAAVGIPEEVMCGISSSEGDCEDAALSLPLFSGSHTIGVLLVWPSSRATELMDTSQTISFWTDDDRHQISRAGETLALALCMDSNMMQSQVKTEQIRVALADSLHQVKNPIQAMRTFSKLLQRNIAGEDSMPRLVALADNIAATSDRMVDLLLPMDSIVHTLDSAHLLTGSAEGTQQQQQQLLLAPIEQSDLILRPKQPGTKSEEMHSKKELTPLPEVAEIDVEMAFVSDVLTPIFSASKAVALDKGIDFEIYGIGDDSELPGVFLCPRALQEAVVNILDNAIKYVSFGENGKLGIENEYPKIRVSLVSSDTTPAGVIIWIEDNGPGIQSSERQAIFLRGYRSDTTGAVTSGSGIGLDISKTLILGMGGALDFVDDGPENLGGAAMRIKLFRN